METLGAMFRNLCKEIETEFIGAKLYSEEKAREWQTKINNIELWDMRYLKKYIAKFSQYYYKIGQNETNLGMFYDKFPYPINSTINEKYMAWLKKNRCHWYSWFKNILFKKMSQWSVSWSPKPKEN